jgi:hypothetical protein
MKTIKNALTKTVEMDFGGGWMWRPAFDSDPFFLARR